jgi:hypothetical protein
MLEEPREGFFERVVGQCSECNADIKEKDRLLDTCMYECSKCGHRERFKSTYALIGIDLSTLPSFTVEHPSGRIIVDPFPPSLIEYHGTMTGRTIIRENLFEEIEKEEAGEKEIKKSLHEIINNFVNGDLTIEDSISRIESISKMLNSMKECEKNEKEDQE